MSETATLLVEIFGYIGTALVLTSMMMTSVVKLRVVNMCGSFISMIYAIITKAWPVVLLNAGLIIINAIQLIRVKFDDDQKGEHYETEN